MILRKYFHRELYRCALSILIVLLLIFTLNQFMNFLSKVSAGDLTLLTLVKLVGLQWPELIVYLSPLSLYLAIFVVVGRWCIDRELVVSYACGVSRSQFYLYVLGVTVPAAILLSVLTFWLVPLAHEHRLQVQEHAFQEMTLRKVEPKRFQPLDDKGGVIYASGQSEGKDRLDNVFVARKVAEVTVNNQLSHNNINSKQTSKKTTWFIVSAAHASQEYIKGIKDPYLYFDNGTRYVGASGYADYSVTDYKRYGVLLKTPDVGRYERIDLLPTTMLLKKIHTDNEAMAEWDWRCSMPIATILMGLLAIPLAQVNPRKGRFGRLVPAILIYIVYANFLFMTRDWIQDNKINPNIGMWWVHGLFLLISIIFISRHLELISWLRRKFSQVEKKG